MATAFLSPTMLEALRAGKCRSYATARALLNLGLISECRLDDENNYALVLTTHGCTVAQQETIAVTQARDNFRDAHVDLLRTVDKELGVLRHIVDKALEDGTEPTDWYTALRDLREALPKAPEPDCQVCEVPGCGGVAPVPAPEPAPRSAMPACDHDECSRVQCSRAPMPQPVQAALETAQAEGFRYPVRSWRSVGDERHALYILDVECAHPVDDYATEMHTYVVAADTHNDGGAPRLHHLSTATHILQNVGSTEQWEIAGREPDAVSAPPDLFNMLAEAISCLGTSDEGMSSEYALRDRFDALLGGKYTYEEERAALLSDMVTAEYRAREASIKEYINEALGQRDYTADDWQCVLREVLSKLEGK